MVLRPSLTTNLATPICTSGSGNKARVSQPASADGQRPAAVGELRRFGQKYGWGALLNIKPQPSELGESHVVPMLERHPNWLVTPLVRMGNKVAVGWYEDRWRAFLKGSSA